MQRARSHAGCGAQHVAGQSAVAGAGFHDDEGVGRTELAPGAIERAGDARTEQRSDFRAGHEVPTGAPRAVPRREEADIGLVEGQVDEAVERDRTFAPDAALDRVGGASG